MAVIIALPSLINGSQASMALQRLLRIIQSEQVSTLDTGQYPSKPLLTRLEESESL